MVKFDQLIFNGMEVFCGQDVSVHISFYPKSSPHNGSYLNTEPGYSIMDYLLNFEP